MKFYRVFYNIFLCSKYPQKMSTGDNSSTSSRPKGGRFTVVVQKNDAIARESDSSATNQLRTSSNEALNEGSLQTPGNGNSTQLPVTMGDTAPQQYEISTLSKFPDVYETVTSLASIGCVKNVYVNVGNQKPTRKSTNNSPWSLFL